MTEKKYVAAIDQGTTGTRFMIFTQEGLVSASKYEEHKQVYPKPGWVEHDPLEIWEKTRRVMKRALRAKVKAKEIAAIGVTNQRETTVIWDPRTGKPLYNAIVWQCTRTKDICQDMINRGLEGAIRKKTGLRCHTYFSGPKIKWILDNVPSVRKKANQCEAVFGNMDTWIIWNLTGGPSGGAHVTDYTNASRTMLMNLKTLDWDDEILKELDIPREMLPEIKPSSDKETYGVVKDGLVNAEIPVCGDLGDQQAALFGQACFKQGEMKNTYGTGCFILLNTGRKRVRSKHGLLTTIAYGLEKGRCMYALEGSIAIAGAAIQWLRDNLQMIKSASETEEIARSVEDAGGIYFVPAFSGLFAPYWDMRARGAIVGLTRFVKKEHFVRAVLESLCYQTRDMLEAMKADTGITPTTLKVDGGATVNNFLLQLQADILGMKIVRPIVKEITALGAAYAAGLAVGFWDNLDVIKKNWLVDRIFKPRWGRAKREAGYRGWGKAIQRARGWVE